MPLGLRSAVIVTRMARSIANRSTSGAPPDMEKMKSVSRRKQTRSKMRLQSQCEATNSLRMPVRVSLAPFPTCLANSGRSSWPTGRPRFGGLEF